MQELHTAGWIKLKAALFLWSGMLAVALLIVDRPSLKVAFLLSVAIWSFCRAYYFAFYVLERYLDPGYRFSGLVSLARYFAAGWTPRK